MLVVRAARAQAAGQVGIGGAVVRQVRIRQVLTLAVGIRVVRIRQVLTPAVGILALVRPVQIPAVGIPVAETTLAAAVMMVDMFLH